MHISRLLLCSELITAANVLLSNDDGWAEINIRTFYNALTTSNNSVLLSAPAENESGTGSSDSPAQPVGSSGCEYNSCPAGSPAEGSNSTNPRYNYVNSYPATSIKYGLQIAPQIFNGSSPDVIVTGPNVGANAGATTLISGTVGAAVEGASQGYLAIAFSGSRGSQTAWTVDPVPDYSLIYADAAAYVTNQALIAFKDFNQSYWQNATSTFWLNVNFPTAGEGTDCTDASKFKYTQSRINMDGNAQFAGQCNGSQYYLPLETDVLGTEGCWVSVSVGNVTTKADASKDAQLVAAGQLNTFSKLLTCWPYGTNSTSTTGTTSSASATPTNWAVRGIESTSTLTIGLLSLALTWAV